MAHSISSDVGAIPNRWYDAVESFSIERNSLGHQLTNLDAELTMAQKYTLHSKFEGVRKKSLDIYPNAVVYNVMKGNEKGRVSIKYQGLHEIAPTATHNIGFVSVHAQTPGMVRELASLC